MQLDRWYFVPAGESSAPAPAPAPSSEATPSSSSSSSDGAYQFNEAKDQVKAAVAPSTASAENSTPAAAPSSSGKQATWNPAGFWESSSSTISLDGIDTSKVNKQDRATWICRHPGWWLAK